MIQSIFAVLRAAEERNHRAVILVPRSAEREALVALGCAYPNTTERTTKMANGQLVSVYTPDLSVTEVTDDFVLYLLGWGAATPQEERRLLEWIQEASSTVAEVS